jgi:DNA-binding FadR family transcriptional regulator
MITILLTVTHTKTFEGWLRARQAMDVWTMRLAAHRLRPWATRRCADALPTAATFDHMPTAFDRNL